MRARIRVVPPFAIRPNQSLFRESQWAQCIRKLTRDLGIYFIVDEVVTSVGVTGTFWAHEQWGLDEAPDFVTFAKKM